MRGRRARAGRRAGSGRRARWRGWGRSLRRSGVGAGLGREGSGSVVRAVRVGAGLRTGEIEVGVITGAAAGSDDDVGGLLVPRVRNTLERGCHVRVPDGRSAAVPRNDAVEMAAG